MLGYAQAGPYALAGCGWAVQGVAGGAVQVGEQCLRGSGLLRWAGLCHHVGRAVPELCSAPCLHPVCNPLRSFPVAIPGTAFARGMRARRALLERIHASLDLLEERKNAAGGGGAAGAAGAANGGGSEAGAGAEGGQQVTTLDLLMGSRDDQGSGLTRHAPV